jgi:hypothetical protein
VGGWVHGQVGGQLGVNGRLSVGVRKMRVIAEGVGGRACGQVDGRCVTKGGLEGVHPITP